MTLNIDDIMADFRRNGRDSEYTTTQNTSEWQLPYDFTSPWSVWHSSDGEHSKGTLNGSSSRHQMNKLVQGLSALDLSGTRHQAAIVPPHSPHRSSYGLGKYPSGNFDYASLLDESIFSSSPASLQGDSGQNQSEAFFRLVQEKTEQLSRNRWTVRNQDVNLWRSFDLAGKRMSPTQDPLLGVYSLSRKLTGPVSKSRGPYWERHDNIRLTQRRNAVVRESRCDTRWCQHARSAPRVSYGPFALTERDNDAAPTKFKETATEASHSLKIPNPKKVASCAPNPEPTDAGKESKTAEKDGNSTSLITNPAKAGPTSGAKQVSHSAPTTPTTEGALAPPSSPSLAAQTGSGCATKEPTRSKKSQSRRRRYSSESHTNSGCAFCKKNGEAPSVYKTHVVKSADGRTVCQVLQEYVCPLCGATGENAHTVKYCSKNLNPHASPSERPRKSRNSSGRLNHL